MRITVGISTWNRSKLLDMTLERMRQLRIPAGVTWELLVVNNNSSDETDAVLSRYADKLPLRRLFEAKQGKSHACNLLVAEASGEIILWTDDDVLVDPEWLAAYHDAALKYPSATYFAGTIEPLFETPPPSWVTVNPALMCGPFAILSLGSEMRELASEELPFGANMAIRTDAHCATPFDPRLGPNGSKPWKGEDTRLIEDMQKRGMTGVWVGGAKVEHWVPKERMTLKYVWDWYYSAGVATARTENLPGRRLGGIPRWVIRAYFDGIAAWLGGRLTGNVSKRLTGLRIWAQNGGVVAECRRQHKLGSRSGNPA